MTAALAQAVAGRIDRLLRNELGNVGTIALHEPWIGAAEKARVLACLDSGWVSTAGPAVTELEGRLADLTGRRHAVSAVNGTSALHVLLRAMGIGNGDLVICPAISFAATAAAIVHAGAEPVFVDVATADLALDPSALDRFLREDCEGQHHRASGRRIAAAIVVDVFGQPADHDALAAVAARHDLTLIEDAAESLGARFGNRPCGSFGHAAILSFNGNKTVTAGGGGAIVTDDAALAARVAHLAGTARLAHPWVYDHDDAGYNYRMPSLNAALCLGQLETLTRRLDLKRQLHDRYKAALAEFPAVTLLDDDATARGNFWLCALVWPDRPSCEAFLSACHELKLQARRCWRALPDLSVYRAAPRASGGVACGIDLSERIANLPSSPQLMLGAGAAP